MTKHFHRFRSIDALLDGRHELENQEIFFASPAQLNDPREGVRDVFWLGDRVVWKNLHRHYLKSLTRLLQIWCASGGQHEVDWRHVTLFDPILPATSPLSVRWETFRLAVSEVYKQQSSVEPAARRRSVSESVT